MSEQDNNQQAQQEQQQSEGAASDFTSQNLAQLASQAAEVGSKPVLPPADDDYVVVPQANGGIIINRDPQNVHVDGEGNVTDTSAADNVGGGIIIDNGAPASTDAPTGVKIGGLSSDQMSTIDKYTADMEKDIETAKINAAKVLAAKEAAAEEEKAKTPQEEEQELNEKFDEAIVIIDKVGMGQVKFTAEEREKLQLVKSIKVHEVQNVDLSTFKRKKGKRSNLDNILKRQITALTTQVIFPASGYTATMTGCSTYELIAMMGSTEDDLINAESRWTLFYNKVKEASIGDFEDFNDFLQKTAATEANNFIYGIICSTYPDDDKIQLTCPKCKSNFFHTYNVRSLLRVEKFDDKLKLRVQDIVDNSHTEEGAQQIHAQAPVNTIKGIRLPDSGIIVELRVQSAYDLLYGTIKSMQENTDPHLNQAAILSTAVAAVHIPDPDSEGDYLTYDEPMDITKAIYNLHDTDLIVLTRQTEEFVDNTNFEYGLMNVKCQSPKCGHYIPTLPIEVESILFIRYQQAMSTEID